MLSLFVILSPTPPAPKDASVEKPTAISSVVEEITVEVVEGSSTVHVVEEVVAAKATATTEVVAEAEAKMAHDAAEASGQGGESSDHRAGKEVVADITPGPQGEAAITESEEE